ncbi:MAG: Crp/Fnr family transcriptional regulator [Magnetococcales bacterium]|nr:Crp/Fnr family transcriptional regulator [Magnetococcales bacterium]
MIVKKSLPDDMQKIWKQLSESHRGMLLRFAQFLLTQEAEDRRLAPTPTQPLGIPAPSGESVVQALKRLKKNYPMIDTDIPLLDAASQLVMQKVLGASDAVLIEKMEALFLSHYQRWRERTSE